MHLNQASGWIEGIEHQPSPNFDQRPASCAINLLVIHGISLPPGEYGGPWITSLFCNTLDCNAHPYFDGLRNLKVSAHLLIRRDGYVIQYVSLNDRAWHAGASSFEGRERCNDFSIGVELEGEDATPYTERQYQVLIQVTRIISRAYPLITPTRIKGHSDIAPGRKTDPGEAFDWERYLSSLEKD